MTEALKVRSPVVGTVVAEADIPDPVFSAGLVGPGLAVDPGHEDGGTAVAPVAGTVVKLHPHAYVIADDDGRAILVHLGIDTVQLKGEGFELHVAQGDRVTAGQTIVTWSPAAVHEGGRSTIVPVVALDMAPDAVDHRAGSGTAVTSQDLLFTVAPR